MRTKGDCFVRGIFVLVLGLGLSACVHTRDPNPVNMMRQKPGMVEAIFGAIGDNFGGGNKNMRNYFGKLNAYNNQQDKIKSLPVKWVEDPRYSSGGYYDGTHGEFKPPTRTKDDYFNALKRAYGDIFSGEVPLYRTVTVDTPGGSKVFESSVLNERYQELLNLDRDLKRVENYARQEGIDPRHVDRDYAVKKEALLEALAVIQANRRAVEKRSLINRLVAESRKMTGSAKNKAKEKDPSLIGEEARKGIEITGGNSPQDEGFIMPTCENILQSWKSRRETIIGDVTHDIPVLNKRIEELSQQGGFENNRLLGRYYIRREKAKKALAKAQKELSEFQASASKSSCQSQE